MITNNATKIFEKAASLHVDAHWFRRIFHTFSASFLIYYILPQDTWIFNGKILAVIIIIFCFAIIETIRVHRKIRNISIFGLRDYEKDRPASYLYFGIGLIVLLFIFPQQIAIPCILCASLGDPIIGEIRTRYKKQTAQIIGFLCFMFFFFISWYQAPIWVLLTIILTGATMALIAETKKFFWIDDDFMIQILPAITLSLIIWVLSQTTTIVLPPETLIPIS